VLGGDLAFARPPVVAFAPRRIAVIDWPLKLLARGRDGGNDRRLLFDLATDPGEQHDLAATRKDDLRRLDALRREAEQAAERGAAP
jgi:hypothetical protein